MKLLAVGHSLVIDSNRQFWSEFAQLQKSSVDVVCPLNWSSNLNPRISYQPNAATDAHLRAVFPIRVFYSGNGSFFSFNPLQLWRVLSKEKYDAIYLNQETWALATLTFIAMRLISRNRSTPLLLCVAQNIRKEKLKFLHAYERFISRFIKAFLFCSQGVEDVLRWKGIKTPCFYFPLPYSDQSYAARPSQPQLPFRLGYLGRLTEDKGLGILLRALDHLNSENIRYRLVIGGKGPMLAELQKRSYVDYRGLIPHNQAHQFYQEIDCFVLPSQTMPHWKEQFGRVIVESFAAGKPVIGSSSGSIPEVLSRLQWPWVFAEESVHDLTEKIVNMEMHLATSTGQQALERAIALNQSQFSQFAVADRLFKDLQLVTATSL